MYKRDFLNTLFEDYIIFRELNIVKEGLPKFDEIKSSLNLKLLPRKKDKDYVRVLSYLIDLIGDFKKIVYLGDTFLNDKSVIENLTSLNRYEVFGIITEGKGKKEKIGNIILNDRWEDLIEVFKELNIEIDKDTLFIVDIDKTLIGARGRNDFSIDKARFDAIKEISKDLIGDYDERKFFEIYKILNDKKFHNFTEDNQDIVTLLTIIFYLGLYDFQEFIEEYESGKKIDKLNFFKEILEKSNKNLNFYKVLERCTLRIENGDPTPFLEFRYKEFESTIKRMDFLSDYENIKTLLEEEIMITKEVYDLLIFSKEKGALLFGLSDKPEASTFPQKGCNLPPIYLKKMKIF